MADLEILLERPHFEALMKTKRFDRGYLIGKVDSGLFVAESVHPLPQRKGLAVHTDTRQIVTKVLVEKNAYIAYINDSDQKKQDGFAVALLQAGESARLNKFCAYGVVNGELRFYRVKRYSDNEGYEFESVPFRLRGEDRRK